MDEQFRRYYNEELNYLRELGGEFADAFPKIAGRLGMSGIDCADPYVERLLEGFAFLSTRVRLKIDSEFPRFTRHLLDMIYPGYLSPMPSMAIVQMNPDPAEPSLDKGYEIPKDASLKSMLGKGEQTRCEYRTGHTTTLWPIEIAEAKYLPNRASLAAQGITSGDEVRAGLSLSLKTTGGQNFSDLALDKLTLFLRGSGAIPTTIFERIIGYGCGAALTPGSGAGQAASVHQLDPSSINPIGFDKGENLLPKPEAAFDGYRLLQEYFAFPQRFLFVEIDSMQPAVNMAKSQTLTVTFLFSQQNDNLIDVVTSDNFALHCVPCINLFPKRADRIALNTKDVEFHIVPDRARPMDFEIWSVEGIKGIGTNTINDQVFAPLYGSNSAEDTSEAYFVVNRERRRFSAKQRRTGSRTSYMGTECYVSLVDGADAPYSSELRQLEVRTLCTNRDLPLQMTLGQGATDFDLQSGAPVQSIRCVAGPSRPRPSFAEGDTTWRLINALSLNYLSLAGEGAGGAEAIRDLLRLFVEQADASARHQVESLIGINSTPINARLPTPGPMAFGRGIGIELEMDESGFEGTGVFLMASVLERFFARYVTVNSFVATTLTTTQRGEVLRWPARAGSRVLL